MCGGGGGMKSGAGPQGKISLFSCLPFLPSSLPSIKHTCRELLSLSSKGTVKVDTRVVIKAIGLTVTTNLQSFTLMKNIGPLLFRMYTTVFVFPPFKEEETQSGGNTEVNIFCILKK